MIQFTREAILIFGFPIYYYGLIIMVGVIASANLAAREAERRGMNAEFLLDSLIWVVIFGIIGARVWHILTPSPSLVAQGITTKYYLTHPLDALNIRSGGLGIPGAVLGGLGAFYVFARRKGEGFLPWIDVIAPALPLGQAIGRWGNFVNQELYGSPSDLPWAITIAPENRLPQFADVARYHPIFLYESLWSLGTVVFLLWLAQKHAGKLLPGDLFLAYMITYPIIRILLDFLRLDASEVGGVNANQTFMAVVLVSAAGMLMFRHKRRRKLAGADAD